MRHLTIRLACRKPIRGGGPKRTRSLSSLYGYRALAETMLGSVSRLWLPLWRSGTHSGSGRPPLNEQDLRRGTFTRRNR